MSAEERTRKRVCERARARAREREKDSERARGRERERESESERARARVRARVCVIGRARKRERERDVDTSPLTTPHKREREMSTPYAHHTPDPPLPPPLLSGASQTPAQTALSLLATPVCNEVSDKIHRQERRQT